MQSMGRIGLLSLDSQPTINDSAVTAGPEEVRGEIEFRNLTFTYPTLRSDVDGVNSSN